MSTILFYCPDCQSPLSLIKGKYFCPNCQKTYAEKAGIIKLLPRILSENKVKEDDVYELKGLDNSWYNNQVWYYFIHLSSHIVRFEKEILHKIKGPKVLEIASGTGWASCLVKKYNPKFEVFSTDVSFKSLDIQARQMSKIINVKPDYFVACDVESLPFKDQSFDTVFVIASIHHFFDIPKALSEIKRVLKPGGLFLAVDGMMPKIARKILRDGDSERTSKFGILERKITYDEWLNYLKKSNIPTSSLKLNYDTSYIHSYATNADEEKLIRKSWLFNVLKEIVYGAFLSKLKQETIVSLKLAKIFPAGIVIEYLKGKK